MWNDWPTCPGCGRRRLARCPACEETGTDFPLAEYHERGEAARMVDSEGAVGSIVDPDGELPFLICPHCDETFVAAFYRHCAWCSHDAGRGLEPAAPREPLRAIDRGLVFVFAALACVAAVLILGWAWSQRG
jgi:hypothetical protein